MKFAKNSKLVNPSLKSPQPPFNKGGQGGFLAGLWYQGKSWLLIAALPIRGKLLKSDPSRTFRTQPKIQNSPPCEFR